MHTLFKSSLSWWGDDKAERVHTISYPETLLHRCKNCKVFAAPKASRQEHDTTQQRYTMELNPEAA